MGEILSLIFTLKDFKEFKQDKISASPIVALGWWEYLKLMSKDVRFPCVKLTDEGDRPELCLTYRA